MKKVMLMRQNNVIRGEGYEGFSLLPTPECKRYMMEHFPDVQYRHSKRLEPGFCAEEFFSQSKIGYFSVRMVDAKKIMDNMKVPAHWIAPGNIRLGDMEYPTSSGRNVYVGNLICLPGYVFFSIYQSGNLRTLVLMLQKLQKRGRASVREFRNRHGDTNGPRLAVTFEREYIEPGLKEIEHSVGELPGLTDLAIDDGEANIMSEGTYAEDIPIVLRQNGDRRVIDLIINAHTLVISEIERNNAHITTGGQVLTNPGPWGHAKFNFDTDAILRIKLKSEFYPSSHAYCVDNMQVIQVVYINAAMAHRGSSLIKPGWKFSQDSRICDREFMDRFLEANRFESLNVFKEGLLNLLK